MYTFSGLKNYLDTILVREKVPGFDCRVYKDGAEVFSYHTGYADKENQIPMKGNEHYFIYSASKPITCAAAIHAMEEGKLLMTHPVWWYLYKEGFKDIKIKVKNEDGSISYKTPEREMRVHDLFNMTAGFNYDCAMPEIKAVLKENPNATTSDIVAAIGRGGLDFEPNTRWQYSLCHDVLARVVEAAVGERFEDYVKRVIFEPLGMKNTTYHATPAQLENMCAQYCFNYSKGMPERVDLKNGYVFTENYDSGGAGVVTTIEDYSKFAKALANYGVGENGARILSKAGVNLMRTNTLPLDSKLYEDFSCWMSNAEYGYGFGVRTKIGVGRGGNFCPIGEFGWDGAAGALVSVSPEKNVAIVYFQHMLNPQHDCTHNKIKNFVHMILE